MDDTNLTSEIERLRDRAKRYRELAMWASPWERSFAEALAERFERLAEKA